MALFTSRDFAADQRSYKAQYHDKYAKEADRLAAAYEKAGDTTLAGRERSRAAQDRTTAQAYRDEAAAIRAGN